MCADPAVPTDNHAAADHRARTDPTARSYLCSGLNHRQRPDFRGRIDARTLRDNCGRMDTGRNWRHGIEECSNARPRRVGFGGPDRHCPRRHSRRHVRMHDHSAGRCLIERRRITPIVQKTHFIRARRLQRGHTFEKQFEFIRNSACRARNNRKRIWSTSAKERRVTQSCFDHPRSQPANRVQPAFPLMVLVSRRSLWVIRVILAVSPTTSGLPPGADIVSAGRHVSNVRRTDSCTAAKLFRSPRRGGQEAKLETLPRVPSRS